MRGVSRRFAAIVPTLGPLGVLANALGVGGAGGGAAGGAVAAGAGGAAGGGSAVVGVGAMSAGATHVATLLAAAVVTAGGAVELQHTITVPAVHHHHHARAALVARAHHVAPGVRSVAAANVSPPEEAAPTVIAPLVHTQVQSAPITPVTAAADPDDRDHLDDHGHDPVKDRRAVNRRHVDDDGRRRRDARRLGDQGQGHEQYVVLDRDLHDTVDDHHDADRSDRGHIGLQHQLELDDLGRLDDLEHDRRQLAGHDDRDEHDAGEHPGRVASARTVSGPARIDPATHRRIRS